MRAITTRMKAILLLLGFLLFTGQAFAARQLADIITFDLTPGAEALVIDLGWIQDNLLLLILAGITLGISFWAISRGMDWLLSLISRIGRKR